MTNQNPTLRLVPDRPSDADVGRAFLSVLRDPATAWRETGAQPLIDRVAEIVGRDWIAAAPAALAHPSRGVVDDLEARIEELESELQAAQDTTAAEFERDATRSLRALVNLVPGVEWGDGLNASEQFDIVAEHFAALQAAAMPGHGFSDAGIEASQKATFVPCDCGCGRSCCAHCGNDVGFVTEKAALPAVPDVGWQPIETAPKVRDPMIVVRGDFTDRNYVTDPWCVFWQEGRWQRWPHDDPPTHWMRLPALSATPAEEAQGG